MIDTYRTIANRSEGLYKDKGSKFLAFALPVEGLEEINQELEQFRKSYFDARHVCYAYMLGVDGEQYRVYDDGEPSGTAGRPILGQIRSFGLSNVLVVVVRYFGGILLGTGGLTVAYKTAAAAALSNARILEKTLDARIGLSFEYPYTNEVMSIIKDCEAQIIDPRYEEHCSMRLSIRQGRLDELKERLSKVESVLITSDE